MRTLLAAQARSLYHSRPLVSKIPWGRGRGGGRGGREGGGEGGREGGRGGREGGGRGGRGGEGGLSLIDLEIARQKPFPRLDQALNLDLRSGDLSHLIWIPLKLVPPGTNSSEIFVSTVDKYLQNRQGGRGGCHSLTLKLQGKSLFHDLIKP